MTRISSIGAAQIAPHSSAAVSDSRHADRRGGAAPSFAGASFIHPGRQRARSTGQIVGTVAVALPLDSVDATMRRMLAALISVSVGVLGVTAVATYAVVRSSLAPLRRIEATAARIAAGDLSQRVEPAPVSTEVGSLAESLNTRIGGRGAARRSCTSPAASPAGP